MNGCGSNRKLHNEFDIIYQVIVRAAFVYLVWFGFVGLSQRNKLTLEKINDAHTHIFQCTMYNPVNVNEK